MYRVIPSDGFESYILNGKKVGLNWVYFETNQGEFSFLEKQTREVDIYSSWKPIIMCNPVFKSAFEEIKFHPDGVTSFNRGNPAHIETEIDRGHTGEEFFCLGQFGKGQFNE
jgi:hypothetical protein